MNCQDVATLLDDHLDDALGPMQRDSVADHLATCESCRSAWRAARVLRCYGDVPTPAPRPDLLRETVGVAARAAARQRRSPSFWWAAGAGGALAAGIVLTVLAFYSAIPIGRSGASPGLTIALNETRDVSVAIESAEMLAGVQIRVVLAGGIELAPFRGRSEVAWKTDLDAGVNRLRLPIVAIDASGGDLLVEVEHNAKRRLFVVHIDVSAPDTVKYREPSAVSGV
jgi:Putative zinc-finger